MSDNIRDVLAREAAEAEARAEAEDRGEIMPTRGQRGRKRAADPSQVYSVRIPVSKLRKLRELAEQRGVQPTALIRQWVIEQLDETAAEVHEDGGTGEAPGTGGLNLGHRRQRGYVPSAEPCGKKVRRYA
jgi:hypothetical protein